MAKAKAAADVNLCKGCRLCVGACPGDTLAYSATSLIVIFPFFMCTSSSFLQLKSFSV